MIGGSIADRIGATQHHRPMRKGARRVRLFHRVLAVLCFAFVFITATEPVVPFTPDNLVDALEKISKTQGLAAGSWR